MFKKSIFKIVLLLTCNFIFSNLIAQKNTIGFAAIAGTSTSPTGYWGAEAIFNITTNTQIGTGVGYTYGSGYKMNFDLRCFIERKNAVAPVLCFSYSHLFKGTTDYGEGQNDSRKFKHSAANYMNLGGGLNFNLLKIFPKVDEQLDVFIIGGYSKVLGNTSIRAIDPVNYFRDDFNGIKDNLYKSTYYVNVGMIVQLD